MKRRLGMGLFLLAVCCAGTSLLAQSDDHIEVGVFADYFNLSHTSPHINYVGVGGRAAFNVRSTIQIEAEMAYDFRRNFTTTTSNGITTNFVTIGLRPLHVAAGGTDLGLRRLDLALREQILAEYLLLTLQRLPGDRDARLRLIDTDLRLTCGCLVSLPLGTGDHPGREQLFGAGECGSADFERRGPDFDRRGQSWLHRGARSV